MALHAPTFAHALPQHGSFGCHQNIQSQYIVQVAAAYTRKQTADGCCSVDGYIQVCNALWWLLQHHDNFIQIYSLKICWPITLYVTWDVKKTKKRHPNNFTYPLNSTCPAALWKTFKCKIALTQPGMLCELLHVQRPNMDWMNAITKRSLNVLLKFCNIRQKRDHKRLVIFVDTWYTLWVVKLYGSCGKVYFLWPWLLFACHFVIM